MLPDYDFLSRQFYGNTTYMRYNILAQITLALTRLSTDLDTDYTESIFQIPDPEVAFDSLVEDKTLEDFQHNYEEAITGSEAEVVKYKGEVLRRELDSEDFDFIENGMDYRDFLTSEVKDRIKEIYGTGFRVIGLKALRTYHHEDVSDWVPLGMNPYLWHLDSFVPSLLKFFVPINGIDGDRGPTYYISREQSVDILRNYSREEYGGEQDLVQKEADVRKFDCEPGGGYMMNICQRMHRGGVPESGLERDILMFYIVPDVSSKAQTDFVENRDKYLMGYKQLTSLI